ncbi:Endonuclease YhcR [Lentibacillus sp. JNUCC-1]|uniref:5'-nucleotidase C-terminal domain-containing protein n=1 Tax=Lentibacillus sp. JNUCC-1 TaxID=2654513 RepID=UPI001329FD0E|nr:5'-nucleotidase C-terminal domain-containing protein [Lentibacillus sp. JNUCC-1]MUV37248.1 Endonuclease YhcR [Lentibacillus sp. JNUCC-1]
MHLKARQKHYSILLIAVLLLSLFTPAAAPFTVQAADADHSISVAEAIGLDNDGSDKTVKGYIVGYALSKDNVTKNPEEFPEDYNYAIADNKDETNTDNMLYVQVSKQFRSDFGLKTNPNNVGKEVIVTGKLLGYISSHYGLKDPTEMKFTSESEEPAPPLELKTITEVRAQETGEAKTKGIVTAKLKNSIQIQDDNAAIALRPPSLDVQLGDEITVTGSLDNYNGLLQLQGTTIEEKTAGVGVPSALPIDGSQLKNHQSKLVIIENVKLTGVDGSNYSAEDADGNGFVVRDETDALGLNTDRTYESITGIVTQFGDVHQIIPRSKQDVVADSSKVRPVTASPNAGTIPADSEVTLKTGTEGAEIFYTTDGSDPEQGKLYNGPITVSENMTVKAIAKKDGLTTSDPVEFSYTVYQAEDGVKIHHIQGESHESPMKGQNVENVEGIVTYKYDIRGSHYFHMQTPEDQYDGNPKTSEGIVIYTGKAEDVSVGDLVEVTGKVDEYYIDGYSDKEKTDLPVTQINARDDKGGSVNIQEKNVELPAPVKITSSDIPSKIAGEDTFDVFEPNKYAIDFWESIEGMRVEVEPARAVAPQQHGDLVVVTDEFKPENTTVNGGIRLTENGPMAQAVQFKLQPNGPARDFAVKTGDKFTEAITGVVNYGYGNYKVYSNLDEVKSVFKEGNTEPQKTTITKEADKLTVASYNVENFSNNKSETPPKKAENIAKAFVDGMNSPDIIGIVEVMDNNGQDKGPNDADASESYERLISEIKAQNGPTYEYANINPEYNKDGGAPNGNIRVGYLYNPDRVTMIDGQKGSSTAAVGYENGQLTLNPGRVSPDTFEGTRKPLAAQFEFQGESVVVVNNHLNSKRGDDGTFGQNQPPVLGSEAERIKLARAVNDFVKEIKQDNPKENVVVLGDMNDFEFSTPLKVLKGNELTNLIDQVPAEERYSYVFQGNSQVLDHILVSNNLSEASKVDVLHVNADFTDMHGRASDHDPVLAQLDLAAADNSYKLNIMHMNDTHARAEQLPKMLTAIKDFRATHPESLLLNGGDVFSGTLYFNEFKGQADLAIMNMMDIDAMVFGNHEFDLGDEESGQKSLSEFVAGAEFPFLGTNIDFSKDPFMKDLETNESLAEDPNNGEIYNSIVKEVNGEKIGIFGLTTEDTINIASPMDVKFEDFKASAEKAVKEFEDAGINKVVAVNHLGYDSAPDVGNDLRLAKEVDGIDVIIGGHSHSEVTPPDVITKGENGKEKAPTVIVQAGEYGEYLGTLNVSFDDNGEIVGHAGELLEVDNYEADPEAEKVLAAYKEQIDEVMNEEIGAEAMKDLINPRQDEPGDDSVRANETELGNLVTDAMLAKAKEKFPKTVIAFQNGGGIRAPIDKGPITTGEVISVLPFGNDPVIATLTGQEIKDILEHAVRQAPAENGGFLHVSGMKYYYDSTKEPGDRVAKMYLDRGGELIEIQPDGEYLVTTNGFTGQGGDGFETFAKAYEDGRVKDIGETDWQQLRDYMVEEQYLDGVVDPEREGRIIDLKGEEAPEIPGESDENGDDTTPPGSDGDGDQNGTPPGSVGDGDKDGTPPGSGGNGGQKLPVTATTMYSILLAGIILILSGTALVLYRKRKLAH